jgi:hypothetical protein
MDKPNGEAHPNFIQKFEFKQNLIVDEHKLEPELCDLDYSRPFW